MAVNDKKVKEVVKEHYSELARREKPSSCCDTSPPSCCEQQDPFTPSEKEKYAKAIGYTEEELAELPQDAVDSAFGCGNPVALAEIREDDVVLDIGSGAGIDVILAAKKVGPKGKVIGMDMLQEMIDRAKENVAQAGADNVEFRLGEAEAMPAGDNSVDLIISNCVINLAPDKGKVFKEAFRVCRDGGRLMVSDIVILDMPQALRQDINSWASCIGGAIPEEEYLGAIRYAGFSDVQVVARSDLTGKQLKKMLGCSLDNLDAEVRKQVEEELDRNDPVLSSIKVKGLARKGCC